jgi:hypothetical protein
MNTIQTILLTGTLFVSLFSNATAPGLESSDASYSGLTQTIQEYVDYPQFDVEPRQELLVQVKFSIDGENNIDMISVTGNDSDLNRYVYETLDGKSAGELDSVTDMTFETTLRFVR